MASPNADRSIVLVESKGKRRVELKHSDFIGAGAIGDVYRLSRHGYPNTCVKLYKQPDAKAMQKLAAMMQRPPSQLVSQFNNKTFIQFAWPSQLVEDTKGKGIGFLMPEVDYKSTFSLVTYTEPREAKRFLTPEQRSLRRRVSVARNVSALMADLHANGHAFVDFKDQNVRIYPDTGLVAFVDNDGFRIQGAGGNTFAGLHTTPTFNSPESARGERQQLGEHHDRFVLAILLFRLLNFGIHPFQGIPAAHLLNSNASFDIDQFVASQTYAYGVRSSTELAPTQGSIHEHWDAKTLAMFEQTFLDRDPQRRISAIEWARHFRQLEEKSGFERCKNQPTNVEHLHFPNRLCHICDTQTPARTNGGAGTSQRGKGTSGPSNPPQPRHVVPARTSQPPASSGSGLPPPHRSIATGTKWAVAIAVVFVAFLIFAANA